MKNVIKSNLIIFSDLDGTLLDHYTYSFSAAEDALQQIKEAGIPLILCSSKTRAEMELWRKRLENSDPFIVENGAAFFTTQPIEQQGIKCTKKDGYRVIELGTPHRELMKRYAKLKNRFGYKIRGFTEMDAGEVAKLTGLSPEEAALAKKREYTEPFLFDEGHKYQAESLKHEMAALGLNLTQGGRLFHMMGGNDKGKAVKIAGEIYKTNQPAVKTIGLGDSYNDLPLLKAVDVPFLVKKPGGQYDRRISLPGLNRTSKTGPAGWNEAIKAVLAKRGIV